MSNRVASGWNSVGLWCMAFLVLGTARLGAQTAGSVDPNFATVASAPNGTVYAIVQQSDGKLLIGGDFIGVGGFSAGRIARVTTNGVADGTFNTGNGADNTVFSLALQASGKVVLGGMFTDFDGTARGRVAQLNANGTLDTTFMNGLAGANDTVYAVAAYTSGTNAGKVIIGGFFTTVNGTARPFVARLNPNGSLDSSFNTGAGPDGEVYAVAIQADGSVIIGGSFGAVNGVNRTRIARLTVNGAVDTSFIPGAGANASIFALAIQNDGKVLAGGLFTTFGGTNRNGFARLNTNGVLDTTFLGGLAGANDYVGTVTLQADGKVFIGGAFTSVNGLERNRFARLNDDGTLDPTVNIGHGANNFLTAVSPQPDGRIVLGGGFTQFDGVQRFFLARLFGGANPGAGTFVLTATNHTAIEDQGSVTITVNRLGGLSGTAGANFATSDGTAVADVDYVGTNGVLTFVPGEFSKSFALGILDNALVESNKVFFLTLPDATGGATVGIPNQAQITIVENDSYVSLDAVGYVVREDAGRVVVMVVRTGGLAGVGTVDYATTDGTALSGLDYTSASGTLVFTNGQTNATINIPISDDPLPGEGSETFSVRLFNATGSLVLNAPTNATVTIVDNDLGPGTLSFSTNFITVNEGDGVVSISVTRANGKTGVVSVNYSTVNRTAVAGVDFEGATTNSIAFADGETNKTITIPLINDTTVEGIKTFSVTLFNPTGGATLDQTNITVRLIDNDFTPGDAGAFQLDFPTYSVQENAGSVVVTVRRLLGNSGFASVSYSATDGTATQGQDYGNASGTLTFAPGQTVRNFTVPILNDFLGEGDETVNLRLLSPSAGARLGDPSSAVLTIIEDDILPGSFAFATTNYLVGEGDGVLLVTILRTNGVVGTASVSISFTDITATNNTNYSYAGDTTFNFAAGQASTNFMVQILEDMLTNGTNLTFEIQLQDPTIADLLPNGDITIVTIQDNEIPNPGEISFQSANFTAAENAPTVTITLVRTAGRDGQVTVEVVTQNGTATNGVHFIGGTNVVTFDDQELMQTFTIPLIDDLLVNPDRDFSLVLRTNAMSGGATIGLGNATVTIFDDDKRLGEIGFNADDYSVSEDGLFATIYVKRLGGNYGALSVDYATRDGTAAGGVDYANTTGTLTFPLNTSTRSFVVPINNDSSTNGSRSLTLILTNLSAIVGTTNLVAPGTLTRAAARLTIYDDESYLTRGNAGEFAFTTTNYVQADREGLLYNSGTIDYASPAYFGYGAIVTVNRAGGSTGKAFVDYEIIAPTDTNFITFAFATVTNRGTLIFDDYQMSTNFVIPNSSYFQYYFFFGGSNAPVSHEISLRLMNPRGAPGEPTPTLNTNINEATVTVLNTARGFNFSSRVFHLPEWAPSVTTSNHYARITILRDPVPVAVMVDYEVPVIGRYSYEVLQAGSDYSVPTVDHTPVRGTLSWADDDFDPKTIDIPIPNDEEVEFNKDIFVYLTNPRPNSGTTAARLGPNAFCTVTIVAEDAQRLVDRSPLINLPNTYRSELPAGSADLTWNRDQSGVSIDPNPPYNLSPGANNRVNAIAVQPDGKVVIGGDFTGVNTVPRNRIARLDTFGVLDTTFDPGSGADGFVNALAIYTATNSPNFGKVVIGGGFTSINGANRYGVARLNANGSLDSTFNPGLGANGPVRAVALKDDGTVVIGGDFTQFNSVPRNRIARLNADGSLDASFNPGAGVNGTVYAVALDVAVPPGSANQQVVIGGSFTLVNGQARNSIARLNANGSLDANFNPGLGVNGTVYGVAVQSDRKVIIGGDFTEVNLQSRRAIARLGTNGPVDATFDPGIGFNDPVYAVALQPDERVLVGGNFTDFNGTRRMGVARLFGDGSLDTGFLDTAYNQFAGLPKEYSFEPTHFADAIAWQSVGGQDYVLIGGSFTRVGGGYTRNEYRFRSNLARLVGGTTPGPGNISFSNPSYGADESGTYAQFTLIRTNGTLGAVQADFYTVDGTAIAPGDYSRFSAVANWEAFIYTSQPIFTYTEGDPRSYVYTIPIVNDSLIEGNETFTLLLTNPISGSSFFFFNFYFFSSQFNLGGEIIPLGAALGRSKATVTILDDDYNAGVLGFSSPAYTVNENGVTATISVIRTNGNIGLVTVNYASSNGTAVAGLDYTGTSGTLTFASGETNKSFTVTITDDVEVEFDETINLTLSNPGGGAGIGLGTARLTIVDDDFAAGRLNFSSDNFVVSEGATNAIVTVTRTGGNQGLLSVQYATSDGTATAGSDYSSATGVLTWIHGDTAPKAFSVPIVQNTLVESNETVNLTLFNPSVTNALGLVTNATLTIVDDDFYGNLSFNAEVYVANENGGAAIITVIRGGGSAETVSVSYATTNGTGLDGVDYTATNGTLIFGPGETVKSFVVPLLDDTDQDGTRTVNLVLSNAVPPGAGLAFPSSATLFIIDNESANVPAGSVDPTFNPGSGADGFVNALALQNDGSVVIGGDFTVYNSAVRHRIARLLANGSLDPAFVPGPGANESVRALALQSDRKVVIGGFFTAVSGVPCGHIARLNAGGSVDTSFNPGSGFDNPVYAVALQRVGTNALVVAGGGFTAFNGISRHYIARLYSDGSLDRSFDPGLGANEAVFAVAVQPDGKILLGGDFTTVGGAGRNRIARLNTDGSLDASFNPGPGTDGTVRAITLQGDGKIVIGGMFTSSNGTNRNRIARLNADGSLDLTFDPGEGANNVVYAVAVQNNGKIVLGGEFTTANGVTRSRITRVNADGSVDPSINFGTGANSFVSAIALQPDETIVIGGGFTQFDGVPRNRVARIHGGALSGSGTVEFLSAAYSADENAGNALITVRRRGGTTGSVSVDYGTSAGTAVAGVDYTETSGTLVFPVGETFKSFVVPINNDSAVNPDRTVNLSLSNFVGTAAGAQPTATLTIINDDSLVGFSTATYSVNEAAVGGRALISVVRSGSINGTVGVDFVVNNGTATAGFDFLPVSGTLIFTPGETEKTFAIAILEDALIEGNETAQLSLLNPAGGATLGLTNASLTIVDNDFASGTLVFSAASYIVSESATNVVISVLRTNGTTGVISVDYATSDGTASAGLDYTAASGTVAFADGQTSNSFLIPIIEDARVETDETVLLRLLNLQGGATLGNPSNAVLTIVDNDSGAGVLVLAATNYTVIEASSNVVVTVLRTNGALGVVSVQFFTGGGDAIPGTDYTPQNSTLTFGAGQSSQNIVIPILDDTQVEGDESFFVTITNATGGAAIAGLNSARITIKDDDFGSGRVDSTFDPGAGFNSFVHTMALQADGKVVLGGAFTAFNNVSRNYIARLNADGSLDFGFNPGTGANALVNSVVAMPDGKTALGGAFSTVNGVAYNRVARLLTDGAPDLNFNQGPAFNAVVLALALQSNGRLAVGGSFSLPVRSIVQLRASGSVDTGFNPGAGANGPVHCVAVQSDGRVLIGGAFNSVDGVPRARIALLNLDGTLDGAFAPVALTNGVVFCLAPQSDGKVLVGGDFMTTSGTNRVGLVRLNPDGTLDASFDPGRGPDATVFAVALQLQGTIIIGGSFTRVNGIIRNHYARLLPNGAVDASFDPGTGANNTVFSVLALPDGNILIGGDFSLVNGLPRSGVARIVGGGVEIRFTGITVSPVRLTLTTLPGRTYVLEASTDLLSWLGIATNTATLGTLEFTDPAAAGFNLRFYRVREVSP